MALLNPPQILPPLAEAILIYLLDAEGQHERRATLVALMAPTALGQGDGKPGSKALDDTIRACEMLRLVTTDGDWIALGSQAARLTRRSSRAALRACIREAILDPSVNSGPWGSQEGARDLTHSLAWFLAQDLYSPPGVWDPSPPLVSAEFLKTEQLSDSAVIVNRERWQPFRRWSTYLGFAKHHAYDDGAPLVTQYLVPDPTVAVRETLPIICKASTGELDLPTLLETLSGRLPVLDHGYIRVEVEAHCKAPFTAPGTVSPALAHALRRLEARGMFDLVDRADAPKVALTSESGVAIQRSHLVWSMPIAARGSS